MYAVKNFTNINHQALPNFCIVHIFTICVPFVSMWHCLQFFFFLLLAFLNSIQLIIYKNIVNSTIYVKVPSPTQTLLYYKSVSKQCIENVVDVFMLYVCYTKTLRLKCPYNGSSFLGQSLLFCNIKVIIT